MTKTKSLREPISKKLRFEVFKRDAFKCHYCGNHPPTVILEVDHITPVSKGGTNNIDNLTTACFGCNRGKSDTELNVLPQTTLSKIELLQEQEDQYNEYQKLLKRIERRIEQEADNIDFIFGEYWEDCHLSKTFKEGSLKVFIRKLGFTEVSTAMHKACSRVHRVNACIKYFCGICWGKIREGSNG
jgi:hypothetical protein